MKLNLKNKKNHSHTHDHTHSHEHDHQHDHDHNHTHGHHHGHEHGESHHHEHGEHKHHHNHEHKAHDHSQPAGEMGISDKIKLLCGHWVSHNDSHAGTYGEWADKARTDGLVKAADLLNEVAEMTQKISEKIRDVESSLK